MEMKTELDTILPDVMKGLSACEGCPVHVDGGRRGLTVAGQQAVIAVLDDLISVLFPGCHLRRVATAAYGAEALASLEKTAMTLREQVRQAFEYQ